ncbi:MAG TPA: hypothetical protein VNQ90_07035 [Chthoniobacteraceae bacterium]|nr:hypothetical protein [Chthoniobacteraceae bacterium]
MRPVFFLDPVPPFRLELAVWTLRRHATNALDRWDGTTYRRVLPVAGQWVEVAVTQTGPPEAPRLRVAVEGAALEAEGRSVVSAMLERLLGLKIDLAPFYRLAREDEPLHRLAARFRGMKPPRFATLFESIVVGICSQQVSLTVGVLLLNRLTASYGPALPGPEGKAHGFPLPEALAGSSPEALRGLGFSHQKGRALVELARAFAGQEHGLTLEAVEPLSDEAAIERLRTLRGVGPWTAEYVLLRGLGRVHLFPTGDAGALNGLKKWLGLETTPDDAAARRLLEPRRPYAGLIYFHLLLEHLSQQRLLAT